MGCIASSTTNLGWNSKQIRLLFNISMLLLLFGFTFSSNLFRKPVIKKKKVNERERERKKTKLSRRVDFFFLLFTFSFTWFLSFESKT